jgi:hypothetical protein
LTNEGRARVRRYEMNPLTAQFWIGIGIAALCGGIIGFGLFIPAVALSFVTVGILTGVELLENSVRRLRREVHASEEGGNTHGE